LLADEPRRSARSKAVLDAAQALSMNRPRWANVPWEVASHQPQQHPRDIQRSGWEKIVGNRKTAFLHQCARNGFPTPYPPYSV